MCSTETVAVDAGGGGSADSSVPTVGKISDPNNNIQRNPNRRSNKPIMEKRRRARINNCLNELKGILLEAMRKDPARHSKLEKADILELTVSHLKSLHRNEVGGSPSNTELLARYRAGFLECASEVGRFLSSPKAEGVDPATTTRLLSHLNDCLNSTPGVGHQSPHPRSTPLPLLSNESHAQLAHSNNTPIISLLPSRLPSGEIAFVVPGFSSLRNGIQIHSASLPHQSAHAHYQPLLSPEVPLELTVPSAHHHQGHGYNGSTSSPTSSTSSLSPAYSYAHASVHSPFYHHSSSYNSQQPLALVTPKREVPDMSCWRPW